MFALFGSQKHHGLPLAVGRTANFESDDEGPWRRTKTVVKNCLWSTCIALRLHPRRFLALLLVIAIAAGHIHLTLYQQDAARNPRSHFSLVPECRVDESPDLTILPHHIPEGQAAAVPPPGLLKSAAVRFTDEERDDERGLISWVLYRLGMRKSVSRTRNNLWKVKLSDWIASTLTSDPLRCRQLVLHVMDDSTNLKLWAFRNHNAEYIRRYHPDHCFLTAFYTCRPQIPKAERNRYRHRKWEQYQIERSAKVEARYVALHQLMRLMNQGLIVAPTEDDPPPKLAYIDGDILFTNSSASFDDLLHRVDLGLQTGETIESLSAQASAEDTEDSQLSPSIDDVALVLSMESTFYGKWMVNSGVIVATPSLVTDFVSESVLSMLNYTSSAIRKHSHSDYKFGHGDQGKLEWILREAFGFDYDSLMQLYDNRPEVFDSACQGVHPVAIRRLDIEAVKKHVVLGRIAQRVFGDLASVEGLPSTVVLMCSHWMNHSACPRQKVSKIDPYKTCGSFITHFNGCGKDAYFSRTFREIVSKSKKCQAVWPSQTQLVDGRPFSWSGFLDESGNIDPEDLNRTRALRHPISTVRDALELVQHSF